MYYIYVLRCDDYSLYTGITNDLNKRIKEHYYKLGNCAKYTRARNIVKIESVWMTDNKSLALKFEYRFKQFTKTEKEAILKSPKQLNDDNYQYQPNITLEKYVSID